MLAVAPDSATAVGLLFQVIPVSTQEVFETEYAPVVTPAAVDDEAKMRSFAEVMLPATPLTSNFRYVSKFLLLFVFESVSALRLVAKPKLVFAPVPSCTYASAVEFMPLTTALEAEKLITWFAVKPLIV